MFAKEEWIGLLGAIDHVLTLPLTSDTAIVVRAEAADRVDMTGPTSFERKILPVSCCVPGIPAQIPAKMMIPIRIWGGGIAGRNPQTRRDPSAACLGQEHCSRIERRID